MFPAGYSHEMAARSDSPALAFSFLLALLLTGSLLLQSAGNLFGFTPVAYALPLALFPALWLTYGRYFPLTRTHLIRALSLSLLLAVLGYLLKGLPDTSWDGIAYQQPAAAALLEGWNPLRQTDMLWQNIFPSGAWKLMASLASLYGSIEAAKALHLWWLIIALPVWLAGLSTYRPAFTQTQAALATLAVLSPVLLTQCLTHYADAAIYLAGLTFLGALLMQAHHQRLRAMPALFMASALFFIVNAKLAGIYHGVTLCAMALALAWAVQRRKPWNLALFLLGVGLVATFLLGYRPYVTNPLTYGSLLHMDASQFSRAQRPVNLDPLPPPLRFVYSLFSTTESMAVKAPLTLKWPWTLHAVEWHAGDADLRGAGFGPLFALGLGYSVSLMAWAAWRKLPLDPGLLVLAAGCLLAAAFFPEGWWARYVPLAYAVPFLLLLALPPMRRVLLAACLLFAANSVIVAQAAIHTAQAGAERWGEIISELKNPPPNRVYLVPPGGDYLTYNHAHRTLQRRLAEEGIESVIRMDAPCQHLVATIADFKLCY